MTDWRFPNFDGRLDPPPDGDEAHPPHQPALGDACPCDDCTDERALDELEEEEDDSGPGTWGQ